MDIRPESNLFIGRLYDTWCTIAQVHATCHTNIQGNGTFHRLDDRSGMIGLVHCIDGICWE